MAVYVINIYIYIYIYPKLLTHKLQKTIILRCQLFDIVSEVLQVSLFNTVFFSIHFNKIISAVK